MSQLVDSDTIKLMIDETAQDIDNVVLPEDNDSVLNSTLETQMSALGKSKQLKGEVYNSCSAKAEVIEPQMVAKTEVTLDQAFEVNKAARQTKRGKVRNIHTLFCILNGKFRRLPFMITIWGIERGLGH